MAASTTTNPTVYVRLKMKTMEKSMIRKILVKIEFTLLDIESLCSRLRVKIKSYRWEKYDKRNVKGI